MVGLCSCVTLTHNFKFNKLYSIRLPICSYNFLYDLIVCKQCCFAYDSDLNVGIFLDRNRYAEFELNHKTVSTLKYFKLEAFYTSNRCINLWFMP